MRRILTLLVTLVVFGASTALAQTKQVSGKVTSAEDNQPIPGANVFVKEAPTVGTTVDIDGNYVLKNLPANAKTLVFRFIGYTQVEMPISGAVLNASLNSENQQIDEVLVVAYGTAKKSSFTGSVASMSQKQLNKIQASDPAKALEGALAGVAIVNETGQPGSKSKIRIRGIGSINASSEPLVIVDGAPYDGSLSSINSNDIESMNVLKDAASSALYGARGANGVIIITTKKGKAGETKVNAEARVGYNFRGVEDYNIMTDPKMYYETFWTAIKNYALANGLSDEAAANYASTNSKGGLYALLGYNAYNVPNDQIVLKDGKLNPDAKIKYNNSKWNDWEGELMSPQLRQEYNVSLSKGSDNSKVYFSAGYLDDKGYNENSYFKRFSSKAAFETKFFKWLDFSSNTQFARTESNWNATGSSYSNSFMWVRSIAPIYPIYAYDAAGNIVTDQFGKAKYDFGDPVSGVNGTRAYGAASNPVATQNEDLDLYTDYYVNQTSNAKITLPYNFTFSTNVSLYGNWATYNSFTTPIGGSGLAYNGISEKQKDQVFTTNWNQILNWSHSFDKLNVTAMLGHENYVKKWDYIDGEKSNFLDPTNNEWSNAAKITGLTSNTTKYALEGYFGQVTVDYGNKYYISGSLRRDGSSVFHPDHRWGTFWSVGGSWRINQEEFMKSAEFIDNLKLKASYGAQGNDNLYLSGSTTKRAYSPYQDLYEVTSNGTDLGFSPKYKGNKDVTWETNMNFNVGLEFSLFKSLLVGEVEYFNKKTDDMLFNLPVPSSTGFTTEPWNIGTMVNRGIEVSLTANVLTTDRLRWSVNANLTHFKNEVTKLPSEFKESGITSSYQIIKEGGSVYDFYMVKYAGVNQENGDALYWTKNDEGEFEIMGSDNYDSNSKQYVGTAIPDVYGGFGTSLDFYNFDLSLQFAYQIGGVKFDAQYLNLMHSGGEGDNWSKDILNSWTPENKNTNIPRLEYNNQKLVSVSDRFITDASYLSFRNLTLGYTLPSSLTQKWSINSMRAYFVVDNVALWSKRQGMDPRNSWDGKSTDAVYSPIRTMSIGLVLNL